jgi:hypothetical protein
MLAPAIYSEQPCISYSKREDMNIERLHAVFRGFADLALDVRILYDHEL